MSNRFVTLACLLLPALASAGKKVSLFNGHSLAGWHTQGDCQWAVVDSAIRGVDPNGNWCHLVTDSSYTDLIVTLDYKPVRGNSGLYVRTGKENSGCCGIEGTQIDFGPSQDGSVMWVRDGEWHWYELITTAPTQGWVDYTKWNALRVEVQGTGIKTFVNGHAVYATANADKMFATGTLALQLHSGGKGDTILFRNLVAEVPIPVSIGRPTSDLRPVSSESAADALGRLIGPVSASREQVRPAGAAFSLFPHTH